LGFSAPADALGEAAGCWARAVAANTSDQAAQELNDDLHFI
jgi:hypothetical protein